jgi:hypothetical protein
MDFSLRLRTTISDRGGSQVCWLLWVEQQHQSDGLDRLWAGRVPLQDEPVATAYGVLEDALKKLEAWLGVPWQEDALPFE